MRNKLEGLKKKWDDMKIEDKQALGLAAGMYAGLLVCSVLSKSKKQEKEIIRVFVDKDTDIVVSIKGGK